LTHTIR